MGETGGGGFVGGAAEGSPEALELRFEGFGAGSLEERPGRTDPRVSALAVANGARYKSMSPARLPIAREPCLTIPAGFSPSAFLESPVLLTNLKVEPSPTTGTFMSSILSKTTHSDQLSLPNETTINSAHKDGSSGDFEFKPHLRSSLQLAASDDYNLLHESLLRNQKQNHVLPSCQFVKPENKALSSHEFTLSVTAPSGPRQPVETCALDNSASPETIASEAQISGSEKNMQDLQSDINGSSSLNVIEKSAEDGYNWRKYGQKHVKGSENPRSYYKCTHPNCEVKKQLERTHDGQITEVLYKGRHDHPKPQPNRRLAMGVVLSSQVEDKSDALENAQEKSLGALNQPSDQVNQIGATDLPPASVSDDDVDVGDGPNAGDELAEDDDQESKRRKLEVVGIDAGTMGKLNREPRVVVQTVSEVDILDDGYRWRKYGQKVVKGNPNPRSYYKCTNMGCPVRKHVERASHDPKSVITTYEGKHNHEVPAARTAGGHELSTPSAKPATNSIHNHMQATLSSMLRTYDPTAIAHQYMKPDNSNTISLDLGVGISPSPSNMLNPIQPSISDQIQYSQMYANMAIPAIPVPAVCGGSSDVLYGSTEDKSDGFTFKTGPTNHSSSSLCYTGAGNLVLGP